MSPFTDLIVALITGGLNLTHQFVKEKSRTNTQKIDGER